MRGERREGLLDVRAQADRQADEVARVAAPRPTAVGHVAELSLELVRRRETHTPVRVLLPSGPGPHRAVLFLHGGGFWRGSAFAVTSDLMCRDLCARAGCVVVAVDYAKAPEHPWPTALEECVAAYRWLRRAAPLLDVDTDRIAVLGQSSGANLTAAAAWQLKHDGDPLPAALVLEVPVVDLRPSALPDGVDMQSAERLLDLYLDGADPAHPSISPLLADLSGLPRTWVTTAAEDPLRPQGIAFVERLRAAGTAVTWRDLRECTHGTAGSPWASPAAAAWRDELIDVVRGLPAPTSSPLQQEVVAP